MHPDGRGGAERINSLFAHQLRSLRDIKDLVYLSQHIWTKCTDETPIRLQKSDLHRFFSGSIRNGIRRLLHPAHHGGSGTIIGGANNIHQSQAPLSS